MFGGTGDDRIHGGTGNDVLAGGSGHDRIKGGRGRDILIGGVGMDDVRGSFGDDLITGGSTMNENDLAALDQALAEWAQGNLASALFWLGTMMDDNDPDDLWGEQGADYVLRGARDQVRQ